MASPYFSKINLHQQDFSVLQNAGRAWGEAYQQAGAAIGQLGSAYFKRQGMMNQAEQFAKSEMGQEYLRGQGYTQDQLDKIAEDPSEAKKLVYDASREAGGIDKLMTQMQAEYSFGRLKEVDAMKDALHLQEKEKNFYLLKDLESKDKLQAQTMAYYKHLNTENKNGVFNRDADDPTGGFDVSSPEAMQAVMAVNEQMGLGRYNPALVGRLSDSLAPVDEITGQQLPYRNYANEADLYKQTDPLLNGPMGKSMSPELQAAFIERQKANIDGAGGKKTVRELFTEGVKNSGFGAYAEAMKGNVGSMGKLRTMIDTAIVENDDGTIQIKNATAASIALIAMAKNAQGAGQLSDKDVDRVAGRQDFKSVLDRFFEKRIGQEMTLTKEMVEENPTWLRAINPDTGKPFAVGDDVLVGGSEMSIDDLILMREIADGLDSAANHFSQKVIPDIYKNVQATYGGFTIDELNQYTDLHQYMPNGIVNLNPMSQVTTKQMDAVVNMMNDGMTKSQASNFMRQNSMSDPSTEYDEDTDGKAIDAMVDKVYSGQYRSRHNAHVQTYNDQAQYQGKKRRVDPPKKEPVDIGLNPDDGVDGKKVTTQLAGGAAGLYLGRKGSQNLNRGNAIEELLDEPSSRFKEANKKIAKGSAKEVKSMAKQMGLDPKDFKTDKALRSAMKKRLGAAVQGKVTEYLARQGFKQRVIRRLVAGTVTSGAVGLTVSGASVLYDLYDLSQTSREIKKTELQKIQSKYEKGSKDYKLVQELINDLNPIRRLEKSGYYQQPEIGGMGFPFAP